MPKKRNSFYFFMLEIQQMETAKGRKKSLAEIQQFAGERWKQLSLVERQPYEDMARNYNKDPNNRGGKLASDGTRVEDNKAEELEKERKENQMKQDIKRFCNSDVGIEEFIETAPKKLLYFLSFNELVCTDEEEHIPIEVGLVEYSIEYGIHQEYYKILHPGPPPTGYAGKAKQISDEKHEISIFGDDSEIRNMTQVYQEIKRFINPNESDEYPPVFCERELLDSTRGCLEWLCNVIRKENVFQVWDAAYLLMELRYGLGPKCALPSKAIANDLLTKASFNYHPSTRCEFHQEKDNHYCARAYSKRLCYLLSDAVVSLFGLELTERHMPSRSEEEKSYRITQFKDTSTDNDNHFQYQRSPNFAQQVVRNEEARAQTPDVKVKHRQPTSTCIAEEMTRLQLPRLTAANPAHGIGRGMRRN